jgi:hypothetical protein
VPHARAEVLLAGDLPPAPELGAVPVLASYAGQPDAFYRDLLFHGPLLRGIERVEGCGEHGIVAQVRTAPAPANWIAQPLRQRWLADPLVVDCALQLVILWSQQNRGVLTLPCRIGRYRQYRRAYPTGSVRLVLRVTRATELAIFVDVEVLDGDGRLIARLEDCENTIDPGLQRAFRKNRRAALTGAATS